MTAPAEPRELRRMQLVADIVEQLRGLGDFPSAMVALSSIVAAVMLEAGVAPGREELWLGLHTDGVRHHIAQGRAMQAQLRAEGSDA